MEDHGLIIFFLGLFAAFGIVIVVYLHKRSRTRLLPIYSSAHPKAPFAFYRFKPIVKFNNKDLSYENQLIEWQNLMRDCGQSFEQNNVKLVYFVHGTFLGEDPIGFKEIIRKKSHNLTNPDIPKLTLRDRIFGDTGNFLESYRSVFETSLQSSVVSFNFFWSSQNHHAARLKAALRLLQTINQQMNDFQFNKTKNRVLLIGHSHAGQVFALLSHLKEKSPLAKNILSIAEGHLTPADRSLLLCVNQPSDYHIDYVTLGTPVYYPWPDVMRGRLLHIVNHVGDQPQAQNKWRLFKKQKGDLIQQLGLMGSDFIALGPQDRKLNRDLDQVLGKGIDPILWAENIKSKIRVSPFGTTALVDYSEALSSNDRLGPRDIFGHGVYTKFDCMLFNTDLIQQLLYDKKPIS